ncbi:MAG: fused response regulator/phosphatase [Magnetococcales bacterium]|nr:fused response regulator/phosphatase [Magnetococcales bacterium]
MGSRIMVVDDSRTVRFRVRQLLTGVEQAGYEVIEAVDGIDALEIMERTPVDFLPDLILLDRNMPNMSGDACIRFLKSDPLWRTIPVIFLTAQANKAEVVKGLSLLGCDDYLPKPFDAGEMLARVGALLRAKKAEDENRRLARDLELALDEQRKAYDELTVTKNELSEAVAIIESSIRYASRIQRSILPPANLTAQFYADHFILWEPRDMVGGDIYWCSPWGDGFLFVLGDCTGHGVPGAFVSLIATGAFERAQNEVTPGEVGRLIERMHQLVQRTLKQDAEGGESDDGMEMGVCYIEAKKTQLVYAGSGFSLFLSLDGGELSEIKGTKRGIGYRSTPVDQVYAQHSFVVSPGTRFYLTSDGLIDQVGEEKRRSFGKKRLLEILNKNGSLPMREQKELVWRALLHWQGNERRRDDVSVVGFRL